MNEEFFMREAIKEAKKALELNEIPIGCVIVDSNKIIARAHNYTETLNDTTAHAEIQAITAATNYIGAKYLPNATIYVTVEPCVMCIGAIFWSKISKIVYGASDSKQGFSKFENVLIKNDLSVIHPKTTLVKGVLENECAELIMAFFKNKRKK